MKPDFQLCLLDPVAAKVLILEAACSNYVVGSDYFFASGLVLLLLLLLEIKLLIHDSSASFPSSIHTILMQ